MTRQIFASALFAGLVAGLIAVLLQILLTTPLLLESELYESGQKVHYSAAADSQGENGDSAATTNVAHEQADEAGAGRGTMTLALTLITYTGFGLVLVACMAVANRAGHALTPLTGLLWGLAGFAAVQLFPAIGLPPELPGSAAQALEARMIWWAATVATTAAGLGVIAFVGSPFRWAGLVLIALPHIVGAPFPTEFYGTAPPELSAQFVARALATGAIAWVTLGTSAAWFWNRTA